MRHPSGVPAPLQPGKAAHPHGEVRVLFPNLDGSLSRLTATAARTDRELEPWRRDLLAALLSVRFDLLAIYDMAAEQSAACLGQPRRLRRQHQATLLTLSTLHRSVAGAADEHEIASLARVTERLVHRIRHSVEVDISLAPH